MANQVRHDSKKQNMKHKLILFIVLFFSGIVGVQGQKTKKPVVSDANTPLHLLQPEYSTPYGSLSPPTIKGDINRVFHFIEKGTFRTVSYEWGVTYAALLAATQATGDTIYKDYVTTHFQQLAENVPQAKQTWYETGTIDPQMRSIIQPKALDDAGSMCAAMIKYVTTAQVAETWHAKSLRPLIDNYINYILFKEYRLSDGTFARNRPQKNTVWLDDLFMAVPAIAQMGKLTSEEKYYNEAVRQILQFSGRMFVPEKGLYRHGWVESMEVHPAFHWGRANGWAILTLAEVLDVLPPNHSGYKQVLEQFRAHAAGLAACQGGDGFWHQLLDRNDTYTETSATAIFTYCLAHGINKGWLDPVAYGPVAHLGWEAVSTRIHADGAVEGVCVGTGMGFDPAYYYHRPTHTSAAHGYGPVIWAGAEMINLLNKQHPRMNDSAIQYYTTEPNTDQPIFSVTTGLPAGSTRKKGNPVLFMTGDSTMKNGQGKGDEQQWGWGSFFGQFFDPESITVENHALGGRSSRTFITQGLWDKVANAIQPGDYVFIQFGHNDGGPFNTGRARASIKGIGEESQSYIMESNGSSEEVFTFGHYLRTMVRQAKAKGANVVLFSLTPGNSWEGDKMIRSTNTYVQWTKEIAESENVPFVDMNDIAAGMYETIGKEKAAAYFADRVHTHKDGAMLYCKAAIQGLQQLGNYPLNQYVDKKVYEK
jgi:rhamnogalacturonyl hydrolase YesR/lysophospholipase L1-like esterase